jgi:hypothetical protein
VAAFLSDTDFEVKACAERAGPFHRVKPLFQPWKRVEWQTLFRYNKTKRIKSADDDETASS